MPKVQLIAAIDDSFGIAKKGRLPWDLRSDRKYFRDKIEVGPVVMGWNTFAANNYKPYGSGSNIVMTTRQLEFAQGVWILHDAANFFKKNKEDIWVIGGGQIFKKALSYATHLYITQVRGNFDCDVFFPSFEDKFKMTDEQSTQIENGITFRYQIWERK